MDVGNQSRSPGLRSYDTGAACVVIAVTTLLASLGCEQDKPQELPRLTNKGPACAPPTEDGGEVDLVQGRVRVPKSRARNVRADASSGSRSSLPVFEYESALRTAKVTLRRSEAPESLASTSTDAQGRWCVQKPADVAFGGDLRATVEFDGQTLRAPVVRARGTRITVRSEALTRWIDQRGGPPLSRAALLNLEAIISTESDLLSPVKMESSDSIEVIVERMLSEIRGSERVAKMVDMDARNGRASDKKDSAGSE